MFWICQINRHIMFLALCQSTWGKTYSINDVKAGDLVQYGNTSGSGHTIFVTNVSGDTITFVDCNGNGNYSNGTKVNEVMCKVG